MCNQGVNCTKPACQFNHPSPKLWPPHASPQASFGASAGRGAGGRGAHPARADFEPKISFEPRFAFDTLGRGAGRGRGAAAVPSVSWTPQANLGLVSGKTEPSLKASQEIDNPLKDWPSEKHPIPEEFVYEIQMNWFAGALHVLPWMPRCSLEQLHEAEMKERSSSVLTKDQEKNLRIHRLYKRLLNFGDTKARRDVWLESFQLRSRPPEVAYGDADLDDDEPDKLTY